MKKVDKKKNIKRKNTLQSNKNKKSKKTTSIQRKNNNPTTKVNTLTKINNDYKDNKKIETKCNNIKTIIKDDKIKNNDIEIKKEKNKLEDNKLLKENTDNKESLTKSITIPKIKNDVKIPKERFSITKTLTLPKLKSRTENSLTKSITIPKLKLKKDNTLTKSITIPKIKSENIENSDIELDLFDDKNYQIAESLYKDKKYDEAYNIYLILLNKYKKDKRIYKRLINTLTKDYTYKSNSKEFKKCLDDYITTYKLLANKKEIKSLDYNLENYQHVKLTRRRSKFLLIAFLGYFGIHRFIEKKFGTGFLYLITLGFLGIGVIVDLINDYAEYEDSVQLDILRYLISFGILMVGVLNRNLEYFYLIMIAAFIFLPFIYSVILKYIPGFIKLIGMIILIFYGFKTEQVVEYVPNTIIGDWITTNESTNYEELKIGLDKTTLKFDDRDEEVGKNEYDSQNKILKVEINDNKYYRFIINIEENIICSYTESRECIIEFKKVDNSQEDL